MENNWRETYKTQEKYESVNVKRVTFKLNRKTDADIIDALDSAPSKFKFIKDAIRFYIANKK